MQQSDFHSLRAYPSNQAVETNLDRTSQASLQASHESHASQLNQAPQTSHSVESQPILNHAQKELEAEMDVSPTTPPARSASASSPRPPDAPRKSKQTRPPIQLSPHAPVRKLDFDNAPFLMRSLGSSEQSCESHHSGSGRG